MGLISKVAGFFGIRTFGDLIRFMSLRAVEGLVVILMITFMPGVPPYAKYDTPYVMAPVMPLEGKLALNTKLNNAEHWHKGDFSGPESFAEYNGELYVSVQSGDIVKLTGEKHITPVVKFGKPCRGYFYEKVCGRPLGLTFDKNGNLYAADAYYGIFKVNVKSGSKEELVSPDVEIDNVKPKLFNSVVVASSGDIYWTDSSTEFDLSDGAFDMLADGSGRLVHYNPKTKHNKVLLDNIHFANGVALSEDEDFILVTETVRNRIQRYYLKGAKAGTSDIFLDGLPGTPDNIRVDGHGGFFFSLVMAHDNVYPNPSQIFGQFPLVRKFISRLFGMAQLSFRLLDQVIPNDYAKIGQHVIGHFSSVTPLMNGTRVTILHVDKRGEVIQTFHADNGVIMGISEAFIFKDHLILGSPFNNYIGRVPLKDLGLAHLKERKMRQEHVKPLETKTPPPTKPTTQTPPPTKQTPPPTTTTQAPKKQTAPPPTQAPKKQAPPPTTQKPAPTQAPKKQAPPPTTTQPPKKQTAPPPTQAPKKQAPPPTTQAPKKQTPQPTKQAPTPKPAETAQTKEVPKSNTASQAKATRDQPKAVPVKNAPKVEL